MGHTKEPWKAEQSVEDGRDITIYALTPAHKNPRYIGRVYGPGVLSKENDERDANARHIVACVNGCKGINPEAVKKLLEACKAALRRMISIKGNLGMRWELEVAIAKAESKAPTVNDGAERS